jgi:5-guanidino-2-oxopentanoate decarboxylase
MNRPQMTVGRYVVQTLAANGIDTVFGIPGVHNIELYRELSTNSMRHVLVRHEQNAGFAADGYARATGRPAAAFVISGPGLSNILTALAQAYSDSVPVLVIASTPERATLGKRWGVLHELKCQHTLAAGVTGSASTARSASDVRDHLRTALASLHAGRPRPAYVGIPLDVLAEPMQQQTPERIGPLLSLPLAPPEAIEQAAQLLNGAQRPLIIAGGGARLAGTAISRLAEGLDGYAITTTAGKGVLPESHPANLGASLPYTRVRQLCARADVILAAGTELSETDLFAGLKLPLTGQLIRIDIDPDKLSDHYAAHLPIWGDARSSLEALAQRITPRTGWRSQEGAAAAHRTHVEARFDAVARSRAHVIRAIRAAVPGTGAVFSDMTQLAYLANYVFACDCPGTWFHPCGYGTLGYALPAAIGAKVAQPERPILALAGDFGLQFTLQELITAVELELGLPILVWNNAALGQIRDDMQAAAITPVGVTGRNPDFVALAHAYGAHGERATSPAGLADSIRAALTRNVPTLIEAREADFR